MQRRTPVALFALALALLAGLSAAQAERAAKVHRIGWLGATRPELVPHMVEAFRQGLRERGYVEGKNIVIEYRWAEGRLERLPDLAADLVRARVDIIVATVASAIVAAKTASSTIPIVMVVAPDPVGQGFVASLARPGGNITGLANQAIELGAKQLQLLHEAVPKAPRVAVLMNPSNYFHGPALKEAEAAARLLGVNLLPVAVRGPEELDGAFATMAKERAAALLVLADPMFFIQRQRLADLAARGRVPAMYGLREHAEAGGLIAYAANLADLARRAATYVDKILKGARPAALPVEQPTKFDLVINLKAARALGLTFPQSMLVRADEVIQ